MDRKRLCRPLPPNWRRRWLAGSLPGVFALLLASSAWADDLSDGIQHLRHGDYEEARAIAVKGLKADNYSESWWRLEAEALMAMGRYDEAHTVLNQSLQYTPGSIRLRLLARETCLFTQRDTEARSAVNAINNILVNLANRQRYTQQPIDPQTLADAGEAALLQDTDPKIILQRFLEPGQKSTPPVRDAFLVAGRLAIEKHDYRLASRAFADGVKAFPDDADMLSGLAAAFRDSDREKFADYAKQALDKNPHHVPTLLMLAQNTIDGEAYDKAWAALGEILKINPHQPEALALLSAVASLRNQPDQAADYRTQALATWRVNPRVDYLIGLKLSQNYRFTLGAAAQCRALEFDPTFAPARVQLAQDLLRLGLENEGWEMAAQAHKADGYDVEAFNLVTLHDQVAKYSATTNAHFNIRMAPEEARIYSPRVLLLLERARARIAAKYGLNLNWPVTVEIFPDPKDFSVRTFGMPDIGEFLGVTFGPVVTINSPGMHESNWEDVLWHEFTHVVTLTLTHNRMPRWLSEGISVYEEHQASPAWGQLMSPDDRERILAGKMQPISSMSAAFLQAKDSTDTQFAYFESMLVVQFLIERYGFDHLKDLLHSLGQGEDINTALGRHFAPLVKLDQEFAAYAKTAAQKFGGGLDFTRAKTKPEETIENALTLARPAPGLNNFYALYQKIGDLMEAEKWTEARDELKKLNATGLYVPGAENPYLLLAHACAKLGDTDGEKTALTTVAIHEADSLYAVSRLLEIAQADKDWTAVVRWGEASIAIHPMSASAWRALLDAREQRKENAQAVEAGLALLQLDPPDRASIHYRVARQMLATDAAGARLHVLQALEEAPRFRAAYELLATLPASPQVTTDNATPAR